MCSLGQIEVDDNIKLSAGAYKQKLSCEVVLRTQKKRTKERKKTHKAGKLSAIMLSSKYDVIG